MGILAALRGVGGVGHDDCREAMSESGALGRRIPPSGGTKGGDCELGSRGMGKVEADGELNDEGGFDPPEYTDTAMPNRQHPLT